MSTLRTMMAAAQNRNAAPVLGFLFPAILTAIALTILSACDKKASDADAKRSDIESIPECRIDAPKRCEAESINEAEIIYRCEACGTMGQCPDCRDHDCSTCESQPCRCRMKHDRPK